MQRIAHRSVHAVKDPRDRRSVRVPRGRTLAGMSDDDVLGRVRTLVEREHELREMRENGELSGAEEREEIKRVEEALDQCWDLLRQRRARAEYGEDPDAAEARSTGVVENYLQ
jgi:hypothetical protein